jgi:hypothetical protein
MFPPLPREEILLERKMEDEPLNSTEKQGYQLFNEKGKKYLHTKERIGGKKQPTSSSRLFDDGSQPFGPECLVTGG